MLAAGKMSVSTRAAVTLSLVIGLLFLVSGMAAYFDIKRQALDEALIRLDGQNRQVAELQEGRFTRLSAAHEHAKQLLLAELAEGPSPDDARNLDTLFRVIVAGDGEVRIGYSTVAGHHSVMCVVWAPISGRNRMRTSERSFSVPHGWRTQSEKAFALT